MKGLSKGRYDETFAGEDGAFAACLNHIDTTYFCLYKPVFQYLPRKTHVSPGCYWTRRIPTLRYGLTTEPSERYKIPY